MNLFISSAWLTMNTKQLLRTSHVTSVHYIDASPQQTSLHTPFHPSMTSFLPFLALLLFLHHPFSVPKRTSVTLDWCHDLDEVIGTTAGCHLSADTLGDSRCHI